MFFDNEYQDIIPNFIPTITTNNINKFKDYAYLNLNYIEKNNIRDIHDDFLAQSDYMNLNNWSLLGRSMDGTDPVDFYYGLEKYFDEIGYILQNVPILNTVDNTLPVDRYLNFDSFKTEIDLGRPVVVQLGIPSLAQIAVLNFTPQYDLVLDPTTDIDFYTINGIFNTKEVLYMYTVKGVPHTTVAYGYYESSYTYKDFFLQDVTVTEEFLVLANGWGGYSYINTDEYDISIVYSLYLDQKEVPDSNFSYEQYFLASISYKLISVDPDGLIDHQNSIVELRKNGVLVDSMSLPNNNYLRTFSNLQIGQEYTIYIKIVYQVGSMRDSVSIYTDSETIFIPGFEGF